MAQLYCYRWQVEIFFCWLKCTLGCHLLALSENGLQIQIYAALIASLLVVLWTNRKPNKSSLLALSLYFQGWALQNVNCTIYAETNFFAQGCLKLSPNDAESS